MRIEGASVAEVEDGTFLNPSSSRSCEAASTSPANDQPENLLDVSYNFPDESPSPSEFIECGNESEFSEFIEPGELDQASNDCYFHEDDADNGSP